LSSLRLASSAKLLPVGKVIRPHGLKGLIRIISYSGSEAAYLDAGTVFFKSVAGEFRKLSVTSVKAHKNIFLMDVQELNSAVEVDEYRDATILIKKESLTREDDAYFWYELLDLEVYLDTGECLGRISQILPTRGNDIYVVKKGKQEIYIPALYEVVRKIDLENGKMIVSPMEGLLDLNEV